MTRHMPTQELDQLWDEYYALSKADFELFVVCEQACSGVPLSGPTWDAYLAASQKTHAAWDRFYAAYMSNRAKVEAAMEAQP